MSTLPLTHRYAVPSPWMRTKLADLTARHVVGLLNYCEHLRDGTDRHGLTMLALWSDAAVCFTCRKRLGLSGDADLTCDKCGRVSRPTIRPHVVQPAPGIVVLFGLCEGCHGCEVVA